MTARKELMRMLVRSKRCREGWGWGWGIRVGPCQSPSPALASLPATKAPQLVQGVAVAGGGAAAPTTTTTTPPPPPNPGSSHFSG